jgi:hypothetical protein
VVIPAAGGRYAFASSKFAHSSRGLELSARYDMAPLSINGLYTFTDSRERSSLTSRYASFARIVLHEPPASLQRPGAGSERAVPADGHPPVPGGRSIQAVCERGEPH